MSLHGEHRGKRKRREGLDGKMLGQDLQETHGAVVREETRTFAQSVGSLAGRWK